MIEKHRNAECRCKHTKHNRNCTFFYFRSLCQLMVGSHLYYVSQSSTHIHIYIYMHSNNSLRLSILIKYIDVYPVSSGESRCCSSCLKWTSILNYSNKQHFQSAKINGISNRKYQCFSPIVSVLVLRPVLFIGYLSFTDWPTIHSIWHIWSRHSIYTHYVSSEHISIQCFSNTQLCA